MINEGRQVLDFIDGSLSNEITAMIYDIAGRMRQVTRTTDPVIGTDTVRTYAHAYDAARRRVATQANDGSTVTVEGFYGASASPELIFGPPVVAGQTTGRVKLHQTTVPGVQGTVAISGFDNTGETVWTLADYGGSTRAYAAANSGGTVTDILHQNFDGQGLPISVIESSATNRFSGNPLPISFAGNQYDRASSLYNVGGGNWYAADTGRRLSSSVSSGNDHYALSTDYGNARVGAVDQGPGGGELWRQRFTELLRDPSQLDDGYRQVFYVNAAVTGLAAVAAGGIVVAGAGTVTAIGGAVTATGTLTGSVAISAGIGVTIGVGIAAYQGASLSSAATVGAASGLVGGFAGHTVGLSTLLRARIFVGTLAAGGAGGAAEGAIRATLDGQSLGGIAQSAAEGGVIGAITGGILNRTVVGIVWTNQAVRKAISRIDVAPTGASRIYTLTNNFDDVVSSERMWGQTEGAVYGLPSKQFWKGSINPKLNDPGVVIFKGQAATLFEPHRPIGLLSLFKRSLTQHKTGLGDVMFDMSTASRRGNVLIVRNAEMGANLGRVKPFGVVDVGPSSFWGPKRHQFRVGFEILSDIVIVGGVTYLAYDAIFEE